MVRYMATPDDDFEYESEGMPKRAPRPKMSAQRSHRRRDKQNEESEDDRRPSPHRRLYLF